MLVSAVVKKLWTLYSSRICYLFTLSIFSVLSGQTPSIVKGMKLAICIGDITKFKNDIIRSDPWVNVYELLQLNFEKNLAAKSLKKIDFIQSKNLNCFFQSAIICQCFNFHSGIRPISTALENYGDLIKK